MAIVWVVWWDPPVHGAHVCVSVCPVPAEGRCRSLCCSGLSDVWEIANSHTSAQHRKIQQRHGGLLQEVVGRWNCIHTTLTSTNRHCCSVDYVRGRGVTRDGILYDLPCMIPCNTSVFWSQLTDSVWSSNPVFSPCGSESSCSRT